MSLIASFYKQLSFESGMEDMIYVSSGKEIKCFDVRLVSIYCTIYFLLEYIWIYVVLDLFSCSTLIYCIILILFVLCCVLKAAAQWKPLENYNYNKEEINKVDTR